MNLNNKSIQDMNEDFDKIEKQINTPEIYDDERLSLEENILKHKVKMAAYVLTTCYAVFPNTSTWFYSRSVKYMASEILSLKDYWKARVLILYQRDSLPLISIQDLSQPAFHSFRRVINI